MAEPILATTTKDGRFYTWRSKKYWSVTTMIKGGTPMPYGLEKWIRTFPAEFAIDNYERLGLLLQPDAEGYVDKPAAINWIRDASYRKRDRAGDLGTEVHEALEAYTLGKPFPPWTPPVKARMLAFEAFLSRYEPRVLAAEFSCFSRKHHYAGTTDAVFEIGRGPHKGRVFLVDYKTGGKGIFPEIALQLAAYRYSEFVGMADGSESPMYNVDATAGLHFPPTGDDTQFVEVATGPDVFNAFLFARGVYRWDKEIKKTVLLGEVSWAGDPATPEERELANKIAAKPTELALVGAADPVETARGEEPGQEPPPLPGLEGA